MFVAGLQIIFIIAATAVTKQKFYARMWSVSVAKMKDRLMICGFLYMINIPQSSILEVEIVKKKKYYFKITIKY